MSLSDRIFQLYCFLFNKITYFEKKISVSDLIKYASVWSTNRFLRRYPAEKQFPLTVDE